MKKSLLALAALTAFAGAASAQSSVTLFGVVDVNARSVKNGAAGDVKSLSTDGNASSRIGFRGVEDLGGGLRAGFWLEGGMDITNGTVGGGNGGATANTASGTASSGTPGAWFNRRATASLMGGFGEIRLGRDYTPTFWNHTIFDPFGTNGVGSSTNLFSAPATPSVTPFTGGAQTLVRANNSIGYFLPSMGGLYGQLMVAAGENQVPGNKYVGGRIGFGSGPFNVAAAYGVTEQAAGRPDDMQAWNIGGSFNMGAATLMAQYNNYEEGVQDIKHWLLGANIAAGPGTFKISYAQAQRTLASGAEADATQIALGYVYDLSKRTALYAHFAQLDNDAGLAHTAGTGGPATGTLTGFKSTGYEFGVRHNF